MIRSVAIVALAALTACSVPQVGPNPGVGTGLSPMSDGASNLQPIRTSAPVSGSVAPPNAPSGPAVDTFARNFLNSIQTQSIQNRREYCGYFFLDGSGQLRATSPIRGTFASCDMPAPQHGQGIVASYHTHGAYDRGYDNEVPSTIDLVSDFQFGIDGYVSTPGGRVWLVDFQTRSTRQICGRGCVISDANYPAVEPGRPVQQSYSLPAIRDRQSVF